MIRPIGARFLYEEAARTGDALGSVVTTDAEAFFDQGLSDLDVDQFRR